MHRQFGPCQMPRKCFKLLQFLLQWMGDNRWSRSKSFSFIVLEWRNWQTHETQNLALRKQRGGSTPPSSTNILLDLDQFLSPLSGPGNVEPLQRSISGSII